MKVKELMDYLKSFPEDMEVTVYADHGQCDMIAGEPLKAYIHKDDWGKYMMDGAHPDDIVGEEEDYITVCQIGI